MKDAILKYQEKCRTYDDCVREQDRLADALKAARDVVDAAYKERKDAEQEMLDALKSADINAI